MILHFSRRQVVTVGTLLNVDRRSKPGVHGVVDHLMLRVTQLPEYFLFRIHSEKLHFS